MSQSTLFNRLRGLLGGDGGAEQGNRRSAPEKHEFHFAMPRAFSLAQWPRVIGPADALLMGTIIALVAFGVVMVYSASAVFAHQKYGSGQYFLVRQGIYALAGLLLIVFMARFDYHRLLPLTYPLLITAAALMALTTTSLGHAGGGAARWVRLGPVNIQPSEVAKLALICWLAYSLSKKTQQIRTFSIGFLPHVLIALALMALCLAQPDFGSAVMIGMITIVMLFSAGVRLGYILGAGLLAAPPAWFLVASSEYRMRRILAFLKPFENRYGAGYQITESLISFGSGGATGVGLGDSRQKLFFLPEAHTDFISAIIGEELGFIGIALLSAAFIVIIWRGLRAAFQAPDEYGTILATGLTMFIGMQAFTNLAVAEGLAPTKGLVLPFVSYGGSGLLVNCMAVGILLNLSCVREKPRHPQPEPREVEATSRSNMRTAPVGG